MNLDLPLAVGLRTIYGPGDSIRRNFMIACKIEAQLLPKDLYKSGGCDPSVGAD